MASNFEEAVRRMEAALTDCSDHLRETDLWPPKRAPSKFSTRDVTLMK
jgi:hypothetical protein